MLCTIFDIFNLSITRNSTTGRCELKYQIEYHTIQYTIGIGRVKIPRYINHELFYVDWNNYTHLEQALLRLNLSNRAWHGNVCENEISFFWRAHKSELYDMHCAVCYVCQYLNTWFKRQFLQFDTRSSVYISAAWFVNCDSNRYIISKNPSPNGIPYTEC